MLRTIWLKTIRDNRRAMIAWSVGLGVLILFYTYVYMVQGGSPEERERQLAVLSGIMRSGFRIMGAPVDFGTLGGFHVFYFGLYVVLLSVWAILNTTGSTRGEEERGSGDLLLATPHSRRNVLMQKWIGFSISLLAICVVVWLATVVGLLAADAPLDLGRSATTLLNFGLEVWLWGSVGLLLGQMFSRNLAAGIGGGLLLASYLLANLFWPVPALSWLDRLSTFHYYEQNRLLDSGHQFDPLALAVAPLLAILCVGLAAYLYQRRDLGSAGRPERAAAPLTWRAPRSLFSKALYDLRTPTFWWASGITAFCTVQVAINPVMTIATKEVMVKEGTLFGNIYGVMLDNHDALVFGIFAFLPLLLTGFAVTQVAAWAGEEESGRLEVVLASPTRRWQVLAARFAAVFVVNTLIVLVAAVATTGLASVTGLPHDAGRLWAGFLSLLPLMLVVLTAGYALAAWLKRPRLAVAIVGGLVMVSYFMDVLIQLFKTRGNTGLLDTVQEFSIFRQYGNPARSGLNMGSLSLLTAAMLLLLAAAMVGFQRRDVAKG